MTGTQPGCTGRNSVCRRGRNVACRTGSSHILTVDTQGGWGGRAGLRRLATAISKGSGSARSPPQMGMASLPRHIHVDGIPKGNPKVDSRNGTGLVSDLAVLPMSAIYTHAADVPWPLLPCEVDLVPQLQALATSCTPSAIDDAMLRVLDAHCFVDSVGSRGASPTDLGDGLGLVREQHYRMNIKAFQRWLKTQAGALYYWILRINIV